MGQAWKVEEGFFNVLFPKIQFLRFVYENWYVAIHLLYEKNIIAFFSNINTVGHRLLAHRNGNWGI